VTIFDSATLAVRGAAPVAREPRAIVISDDGKTAFVSHAVGAIVSRIDLASTKTDEIGLRGWRQGMDLETAKARSVPHAHGTELAAVDRDEAGEATCQGFALAKSTGRIFAPQVAVRVPEKPASVTASLATAAFSATLVAFVKLNGRIPPVEFVPMHSVTIAALNTVASTRIVVAIVTGLTCLTVFVESNSTTQSAKNTRLFALAMGGGGPSLILSAIDLMNNESEKLEAAVPTFAIGTDGTGNNVPKIGRVGVRMVGVPGTNLVASKVNGAG